MEVGWFDFARAVAVNCLFSIVICCIFTDSAKEVSAPVIMDMASSFFFSLITTPSKFTGDVLQLSESVFELHKPSGKPKLQIVFFHGFQLGGYEDAHLSTWMSRDGSCVWPQTWLVEEFPDAHVFSVAYNARLTKSKEHGGLDLHNIGENIVSDLFEAKIGQDPRCPLIVVGHSFGGIVIKQLCLHASERRLLQHNSFLQNLKGVFFYSTPHHGAEFEKYAPRVLKKSPLLENVKILSTSAARLHHSFENLRKIHYKHWQVEAVGEAQPTQWGRFSASILVGEASSRYGDNYGTVDADHMTVCRPKDKTSRAFTALTNLLNHICSSKVFGSVHQCRGLPDHPSGLDERVTKAKRMLENTSVLSIVGMGGIGKSAIAKQLFNDASIQFEYTCFVDNVKEISIDMLSEKVLNGFYQNGTMVKKGRMEWNQLTQKKAFIVMDDIDDRKQLSVLPKLQELGNGSRLVFTSRKHDVLNIYGKDAECYEVEFLEDGEATKLLLNHIFDADRIPNDMEHLPLGEHINNVVKKCGGLPLTLEVIGCYLRPNCHKIEFWKEVTRKFGQARTISGDNNDNVWSSLMLSYDSLAQEEQEIFIDAATCFFERPLEDALAGWSTPEGGVNTSWNNLMNRSLVKVVSKKTDMDDQSMEIWVHEHLRDLAKKVSGRQDCKCDVEAFQKSIAGEVISVEVLGAHGQLHIWRMTDGSSSSKADKEKHENVLPRCQLQFGEALRNIKYIRLHGDSHNWLIQTFPKKLSLLECSMVKLQQWPEHSMYNLGVLHLSHCFVEMNFCNTLGSLGNLRILSLRFIKGFTFVPKDFGNLSSLKRLELRGLDVSKLPDSFGHLRALEHLILDSLQLEELPGSFGQLKALKILRIYGANKLKELPESFGFLSCLENLILERCDVLQRLPNNFGELVGLKTLTIKGAPELRELCETFGSLSAMTQLNLNGCPKLKNLPSNFGFLCGLEKLMLNKCRQLQRLPNTFGQLTTLKKLTIRKADDLQYLCSNFGHLSSLEELELIGPRQFQKLPNTFGQLATLKKLTIIGAVNLQDLCGDFGLLSSLEELELDALLDSSRAIQTLVNNSEKLTGLKRLTLKIRKVEHLVELCDNAGGHFSALETLELELYALEAKSLPDNFGRLTKLTKLSVKHTDSLEELPDSIGQISSLRHVVLDSCKGLRRLPDSLGKPISPQLALPRGDGASSSRTKAEHSDALGKAVWPGVTCGSCGMDPIEGHRFISIKKRYYEFCSKCFEEQFHDARKQANFVRGCQPAKANGMRLDVYYCTRLDYSVLSRVGWVENPKFSIVFDDKNQNPKFTKVYQRIRVDKDFSMKDSETVPVKNSETPVFRFHLSL